MGDFILNDLPIYYNKLNMLDSFGNPSTMHVHNTAIARYYQKYLLQDAISMIKPTLPDSWAENMVMFNIFLQGGVCVFDSSEFGNIALPATLGGYNVYYAPAYCQVVNPLIKGKKRFTIGKECAYIHLMPDYTGISDIINYYADKLALCDESLHMNIANSKFAYVFEAGNKASAESLKKLFDEIQEGNIAVVYDKMLNNEDNEPWNLFTQNIKSMFISPELLEAKSTIMNEFHTAIGVPNANMTKRERLITAEAESNNVATYCKPALWLDTLNKSAKVANNLFDIDVKFEWRFSDYEQSNSINIGDVPV